jgi:hypothetical protein
VNFVFDFRFQVEILQHFRNSITDIDLCKVGSIQLFSKLSIRFDQLVFKRLFDLLISVWTSNLIEDKLAFLLMCQLHVLRFIVLNSQVGLMDGIYVQTENSFIQNFL